MLLSSSFSATTLSSVWRLSIVSLLLFILGNFILAGEANPPTDSGKEKPASNTVSFVRTQPCNLFPPGDVVIPVTLTNFSESADCHAIVRNYYGDIVEDDRRTVSNGVYNLTFPALPPGYYEIDLTAISSPLAEVEPKDSQDNRQNGNNIIASTTNLLVKAKTSFIVAPTTSRSAAEALAADCRFGIQGGFSQVESMDAFHQLGLHWYRALLCYAPLTGKNPDKPDFSYMQKNLLTPYIIDRPVIAMFEIKTIPEYCYKPENRGKDRQSMIPDYPELFAEFIKKQIALVPPEQKHFEIWNEPPFPPEQFAPICQIMVKAIRAVRPDALIGPNIGMGRYMTRVAELGGLEDVDFITSHPYPNGFVASPESSDLRLKIRQGRQQLLKATGRDLPIYVTEIGWPTPRGGPMVNTERQQAAYMVRAALSLYAEDVKAIMPYCVGQSERNPNDKEHFFGFVRKDLSPKPVLATYANAARIIEGHQFIGDLALGVDIGAMLFQKDDRRVLALYSDRREQKILLRPDSSSVTIVDITGKETQVEVHENRLPLTLSDDTIYIVGVGTELAKAASRDSTAGQWSNVYRTEERIMYYAQKSSDSNRTVAKLPRYDIFNPLLDRAIASASYSLGWDEDYLYLDIDVQDTSAVLNPYQGADLWRGDTLEVFISNQPERDIPGFMRSGNYQMFFAPTSKSGQSAAAYGVTNEQSQRGQAITAPTTAVYKINKQSWSGQIAIHRTAFGLTQPLIAGQQLRVELSVDNLGKDHPRYQLPANQQDSNHSDPTLWTEYTLQKHKLEVK